MQAAFTDFWTTKKARQKPNLFHMSLGDNREKPQANCVEPYSL